MLLCIKYVFSCVSYFMHAAWFPSVASYLYGIFWCRAALKHLKIDRVKKYEYCLPCEFSNYLQMFGLEYPTLTLLEMASL